MSAAQNHQFNPFEAFKLNDLRVDPAAGIVSGPGGSVRLEPRVLAVLQMLASHSGELVQRSDLLAKIWPGGDVYDEALTQSIYQLRQQLGIAAGTEGPGSLITTVPKRGYILDADIQADAPKPQRTAKTLARFRFKHYGIWSVAALLVILLAWRVVLWKISGPDHPAPELQTIAVLPFLPLVETQSDPSLELGMADTLINQLSEIRQLTVRPVAAVRAFGEIERDALQAGRALGADAVVDGSIQRSDTAVRVSVRLLQVADGATLWVGTFDEPLTNIFALQDDISTRIAEALAIELAPQDELNLSRGGTANTEAYLLYIKGRLHFIRLTPPEMQESITYFREAVALDPEYAQAWLGLASALFRSPIAGEKPPLDYYPEAKAAALRALEIDDSLAEGYAILGWIAFWFEWDWAESEAQFQRAIELDPNDMESHLGYAHLLSNTGRPEEALAEVQRAREINPFFPIAAALEGGFLFRAGRFEEARMQLEETIHSNPDFWLARASLAGVYVMLGRYEEAFEESRVARQNSNSTFAMAQVIDILVKLERRAEAELLMDELQLRASERYVPPYDLALASISLGDEDAAYAFLEKSFQLNDPKLTFIGVERRWDGIREQPRFQEFLRRMNLDAFLNP